MAIANARTADYPIDQLFLERWSPRAFNSDTIEEIELLTMLEAARWAASSYNVQPWRFIYARRGTEYWEQFVALLLPFNQSWAKHAAALVFLISNSLMRPPGKDQDVPSYTHSLDAGAASAYFALQASKMGWFAHGMAGIDIERVAVELHVPETFRVEAAYAVGRRGDKSRLSEALQERENPSTRMPLKQLAFEGSYKSSSSPVE